LAGDKRSTEAAERYASALFDLALEGGALDAAARDAASLAGMLRDSVDLRRLAESPAFSAEQKSAGLLALADRAKLDGVLRRFLGVLAANRRTHELEGVLAAFSRFVAKHRGVVTAEVATVRPLTAAESKTLAAALKTAVGRDVVIEAEVRPEILGGLIVKVGSRMFDSSLKTKLEGLKAAMKGA
jgi:F-type H+-transporting ATPase subunit delta